MDLSPRIQEAIGKLFSKLEGNTFKCGDSVVVDGCWIESHTLGCRNAADEPRDIWEESHDKILQEYLNDGKSYVDLDESTRIFVTVTPTRKIFCE